MWRPPFKNDRFLTALKTALVLSLLLFFQSNTFAANFFKCFWRNTELTEAQPKEQFRFERSFIVRDNDHHFSQKRFDVKDDPTRLLALELLERLDLGGVKFKIGWKDGDRVNILDSNQIEKANLKKILNQMVWVERESGDLAQTPILGSLERKLELQNYSLNKPIVIEGNSKVSEPLGNLEKRMRWKLPRLISKTANTTDNRFFMTVSAYLESNGVKHSVKAVYDKDSIEIQILPDEKTALGRIALALSRKKAPKKLFKYPSIKLVYDPLYNNQRNARGYFIEKNLEVAISFEDILKLSGQKSTAWHEFFHVGKFYKRLTGKLDIYDSKMTGTLSKIDAFVFKKPNTSPDDWYYSDLMSLEEVAGYTREFRPLLKSAVKNRSLEELERFGDNLKILTNLVERTSWFTKTVRDLAYEGLSIDKPIKCNLLGREVEVSLKASRKIEQFGTEENITPINNIRGLDIRIHSLDKTPDGKIAIEMSIPTHHSAKHEVASLPEKAIQAKAFSWNEQLSKDLSHVKENLPGIKDDLEKLKSKWNETDSIEYNNVLKSLYKRLDAIQPKTD